MGLFGFLLCFFKLKIIFGLFVFIRNVKYFLLIIVLFWFVVGGLKLVRKLKMFFRIIGCILYLWEYLLIKFFFMWCVVNFNILFLIKFIFLVIVVGLCFFFLEGIF